MKNYYLVIKKSIRCVVLLVYACMLKLLIDGDICILFIIK